MRVRVGARPARWSFAAAIALKSSELVEQLHSAATTDELIGLYRRRALEEAARGRDFAQSAAPVTHERVAARPRTGFKIVNDTVGHAAGDRLLVQVAKSCARSAARSTSSAASAAMNFSSFCR